MTSPDASVSRRGEEEKDDETLVREFGDACDDIASGLVTELAPMGNAQWALLKRFRSLRQRLEAAEKRVEELEREREGWIAQADEERERCKVTENELNVSTREWDAIVRKFEALQKETLTRAKAAESQLAEARIDLGTIYSLVGAAVDRAMSQSPHDKGSTD